MNVSDKQPHPDLCRLHLHLSVLILGNLSLNFCAMSFGNSFFFAASFRLFVWAPLMNVSDKQPHPDLCRPHLHLSFLILGNLSLNFCAMSFENPFFFAASFRLFVWARPTCPPHLYTQNHDILHNLVQNNMVCIEKETEKWAKQAIFPMLTLHYWYFWVCQVDLQVEKMKFL